MVRGAKNDIPQFYLAQCAFQSGDTAKAAQYLRAAESSGAASASFAAEYATLKSKVDAAVRAQKQTQPPPVTAPAKQDPVVPPVETAPPPTTVTVPQKQPPAELPVDKEAITRRLLKEATNDLELGRFVEARKIVEGVLRRSPDRSDAALLLEEISKRERAEIQGREKKRQMNELEQLVRRGDLDSAERTANSIRSTFGSDPELDSILLEIARKKEGQLDSQRQAELRKTVEKQVLSAYYRGDYSGAIELAAQWLQRNSGTWRLHFFVGCSYASLAMMEETDRSSRLSLARDSFRRPGPFQRRLLFRPTFRPRSWRFIGLPEVNLSCTVQAAGIL